MDLNQRPPGYEPDELPTALPCVIICLSFLPYYCVIALSLISYVLEYVPSSFNHIPCIMKKILRNSCLFFTRFLSRNIITIFGTGDRGRTGTILRSQDFKSCASANSATPARALQISVFSIILPREVHCQGIVVMSPITSKWVDNMARMV